MDNPQLIPLDDVVLRDDLDPRLGDRDDDLIQQYADIFDALPPIEINQHNELINGWHRVRAAEHAKKTEIAYVVVETVDDDDLSDKMWDANLKHGVQYTRLQRKTQGIKLNDRGLTAKDIAQRVGVSASSVYGWTKQLREKGKQERDAEIARLRAEGMTQQQIADEVGVHQTTVAEIMENSKTGKIHKEQENAAGPTIEADEEETGEQPEAAEPVIPDPGTAEAPTEEEVDIPEPGPQPETDETPAEEEPDTQDEEPETPSEPIPIPPDILETARAMMGAVTETRPDDYVAKLETTESEWMTITDDTLSNELERELLTSAAAMCLWQEWMVWYRAKMPAPSLTPLGR